MTTMIIEGGDLITPLEYRFANLWIDGPRIEMLHQGRSLTSHQVRKIDASGCFVTPGLFDLQVNGNPQCNLWADPTSEQLETLRCSLAAAGVTSFLPTLITDEISHLKKNIEFLCHAGAGPAQVQPGTFKGKAARMPGIHLEGPCLSPQKPGVHPPQWLKPLTSDLMEQIIDTGVCLVTLAPELEPSGQAIAFLRRRGIEVALGHSNATFEEARQAFDRDVRLITHTFNALPALHHRAAGAVGAALLEPGVSCCLIADGLHVSAPMVRLLIKVKGCGSTILVSDAAATGTSQGSLVGSSIELSQAVRNVVQWGTASFLEAIRMASFNPAQALCLDKSIGHLSPGALADVVLWDKQTLKVKQVILAGEPIG